MKSGIKMNKNVNIYSFNEECYVYLGDYNKLQQENQKLRERIEYLERSNNRREDTILEQRQRLSDSEDNWNKLKEYAKENIRVYKNRCYDLVYDIEEIPKEQQNEFIHYLAVEAMQALIKKIEREESDSNVEN